MSDKGASLRDRSGGPDGPEPLAASQPVGAHPLRVERIGNATLYLADCRDIIPIANADRVVTDVPYGVAGGWGSGLRKGSARSAKSDYRAAFEDTPDYIREVCAPAIVACVQRFASVAVTTGIKNASLYPTPNHVGSFQYPGSTVMSCWGPVLWQPILFYGKDPHQGRLRPDSRRNCNDVDRDTDHPCPKPLKQWSWLVDRASLPGETVFDPFMGSGTTGVACAALGRTFVGCELDPKHFQTACDRIEQAQRQGDFFVAAA
jgi:site-specific DNA-methyltransferase (adenine-specific)